MFQFVPEKGNFLFSDEGCFGRYDYVKQGYGQTVQYKDKNFSKEKKGEPEHNKSIQKFDSGIDHLPKTNDVKLSPRLVVLTAQACLRGAPFGSKGAPRRDEFHQHLAQLQWKEQLEKERKFEKASTGSEKLDEAAKDNVKLKTKKPLLYYDRIKAREQGTHTSCAMQCRWSN